MARNLYDWEIKSVAVLLPALESAEETLDGMHHLTLGPVPVYSHAELIGHAIPGEVGWEYQPYDGEPVKATYEPHIG